MRHHLLLLLFGTLLLTSLAACGENKPTRFYVLTALAEKPEVAATSRIPIVVGPITLPKYLDRPQIVTRISNNSLDQAEFDQWGGDLNDNVVRVLIQNLSILLGTDQVSSYPSKDPTPAKYQITMDVTKFEQDVDGGTVLDVFWSILNPANNKVLLRRRSSYREPSMPPAAGRSSGAGAKQAYDAVAAAMSRDLEALSRDVATGITKLRGS
jgi:uncharacterized lipoprotein YmbA